MITWLKKLVGIDAKPVDVDWLERRQEQARLHLENARARKIKELGPNWIGHPSRHVRKENFL